MDFSIDETRPGAPGSEPRAAIVLACDSRLFFGPHLAAAGALPLIVTTGLMAPEAYTLEAGIERWFMGSSARDVREAAAEAYDHYQHCGLKGARCLFASTD